VARAAGLAGARAGPFLTLAQCTGVRVLGDSLHARFGALCESMEGAAAAHVCALYDVPFLELRGISNLVEDRNRAGWDIPGAASVAQQAVLRLVERLDALLLHKRYAPRGTR
jgi:futalosine hydrolase